MPKYQKSKVTDEKSLRDNSSESSGRISHSGPIFYNYNTSGPENFQKIKRIPEED
jgi:hypothetical protein